MKNYYHILNLPSSSSQAEIKKAYKLLALKHHPDKNGGDRGSEERFKEISEAYMVLGDVAKRNAYDYTGGHHKGHREHGHASGRQSATLLMLFRKIKNKVFNAGGYVNKQALFKVIDDLLSQENIDILIRSGDTATNSLIIDEILISCLFFEEDDKPYIYTKLLKLADGQPVPIEKIELLKQAVSKGQSNTDNAIAEKPALVLIVFFIVLVLAIIISVFT
jgi:molecular chaperone DnaJ